MSPRPSGPPVKSWSERPTPISTLLKAITARSDAFADDCVRHENGYQTVNNPPPGGRNMPSPAIPTPDTPQGRDALAFSMLSCSQQIDTKIFAYMKRIRPRRPLVV